LVHIEGITDYDNATSIDLRNATLGFCAQLLEAPSAHPQTINIVNSLLFLREKSGVRNIAVVFLFQTKKILFVNYFFVQEIRRVVCNKHEVGV
jgi:hypothetical protein